MRVTLLGLALIIAVSGLLMPLLVETPSLPARPDVAQTAAPGPAPAESSVTLCGQ